MAKEVHLNDIGTAFEVTVTSDGVTPLDISGATTKEYFFRTPHNVLKTFTADFKTDGTDGVLTYTTEDGDLNFVGLWTLQAHIITPDGEWRSNLEEFRVHRNLD